MLLTIEPFLISSHRDRADWPSTICVMPCCFAVSVIVSEMRLLFECLKMNSAPNCAQSVSHCPILSRSVGASCSFDVRDTFKTSRSAFSRLAILHPRRISFSAFFRAGRTPKSFHSFPSAGGCRSSAPDDHPHHLQLLARRALSTQLNYFS